MPARAAAVVAEMPDVDRLERVRRAAADAVLGVGRVLEAGSRLPWIVEPEPDRAPTAVREGGDHRVVGVDHERRRVREVRDGSAPALGDDLELAVAIELVAKEVAERNDPGPHACQRLGECSLVDLEEAELRMAARDEGRCDPRQEVRSRAVPGELVALPEDLGGHRRRRGLAVGRRHHGDAVREPAGERVDGVGVELPEDLAGNGRPTAASDGTRQRPEGTRARGLESEAQTHAASVPSGGEEGRALKYLQNT